MSLDFFFFALFWTKKGKDRLFFVYLRFLRIIVAAAAMMIMVAMPIAM